MIQEKGGTVHVGQTGICALARNPRVLNKRGKKEGGRPHGPLKSSAVRTRYIQLPSVIHGLGAEKGGRG